MTAREALHSSKSNDWYTPAKYIEAARATMGSIDLDPASCPEANQHVKAIDYFTEADNGLIKDWHGNVWLNPPYGKSEAGSNQAIWVSRLIEQYCGGNIEQAVLLVNAVTDRRWFAPLWDFPICFTDHRIKFIAPAGRAAKQPTNGNAFVYFGENVDDFRRNFSAFGHIVTDVRPQERRS